MASLPRLATGTRALDYDLMTLVGVVASLLVAGAAAGIMAGMLGVGGGIVIVPVLFHLFTMVGIAEEIRMHLAVGTSLSTIIATGAMSTRSHHRRGSVDWTLLKSWGPAVAIGVLMGTALATAMSAGGLKAIFATVAILVALYMAFAPDGLRLADRLPGNPSRFGMGAVIGGISAMMGIGGGTLSVPSMVLCGYPPKRAVGTSSAIGLIIAIPGTIGFMITGFEAEGLPPVSLGYVSLIGFALIVPTTMAFAPVGARIAHAVSPQLLKRLFALFLAITSLRMFWEIFAG